MQRNRRRPRNGANPQSKLKLKKEAGSIAKEVSGVATFGRDSPTLTCNVLRNEIAYGHHRVIGGLCRTG
ncbi:hypothetical protein CEXT_187961 [Caerostris extrusa]|uniref:Uncharacterized protein n=1 Tax=Caerostris extrusa TaxID=172846 RepID=A0AAV4MM35_CAEEX|nr:hypothetical protein CEXT_187961 [Caerostris extrusa]